MESTSDLHYYGFAMSQPCRSVYALLKIANISYTHHEISMMKGEHKSEDFLKINPKGQLPAIKDGDFALAESNAILKYISTTRSVEDSLYPKDLKQRAYVDAYLEWNQYTLRPAFVP